MSNNAVPTRARAARVAKLGKCQPPERSLPRHGDPQPGLSQSTDKPSMKLPKNTSHSDGRISALGGSSVRLMPAWRGQRFLGCRVGRPPWSTGSSEQRGPSLDQVITVEPRRR